MSNVERLILGDNQFFGINHFSEDRARAQAIRFQRLEAILEVVSAACAEGVTALMCTTHDRMAEVVVHARANPCDYPGLKCYPCMPYAHKYANAVTEFGMLGAVKQFLPSGGLLDAMIRGGTSLASKDIEGMVTLLVDAEMKMFRGAETPVIFLQNVVVDLLLGLGVDAGFEIFARHVRSRYGAEPAFITMNLPRLLERLAHIGLREPIVCANINKIGFRMSGGVEAYRRALEKYECQAIAMSVFASGAVAPAEALDWVCAEPNIDAIVFGASSRGNIRNTRDLVAGAWDLAGATATFGALPGPVS